MLTDKNPRRYEISLWTLQDSFITVLKSFNVNNYGCIQDPNLDLSDDSEDKFSFKLPMYIRKNGEFVENPIWYNVTNGNLMINLRKLKLIFHKGEDRERIFEFVITKVKESHEGFEKYCEIESEGLAFNELGKTGHNIELSQELYENECADCIEQEDNLTVTDNYLLLSQHSAFVEEVKISKNDTEVHYKEIIYNEYNYEVKIILENNDISNDTYKVSYKYAPLNNINYWLDKVLPPQFIWNYRIKMNWDNYNDEDRKADKIYEEAYIENWELTDNDKLVATNVIETKEKLRIVTNSDGNRYNLTQTIAETFGVYCRYVYEYDNNYHIINRVVEFYNNALQEDKEILDFTYYYDTENISREMDSADQVSKMYVLNSGGEDLLNKSITSVDANKTLEDYLLNFDYLYEIGAIDDEQKEEIADFEVQIRKINLELKALSDKILVCQNSLNEFKAQKDHYGLLEQQAAEAVEDETTQINHLLNSDKTDYDDNPETLSVIGLNPECVVILENENETKYCNIHKDGVLPNSILVFTSIFAASTYHDALYSTDDDDRDILVEINQVYDIDKYYYQAIGKVINDDADEDDEENKYISTVIQDANGKKLFDTRNEARQAATRWLLNEDRIDGYLAVGDYQVVIDPETGFATGLKNINYDDDARALYLVYNYNLELYHKTLRDQWLRNQQQYHKYFLQYSKAVDKIDGTRDKNGKWSSNNHGLLQDYLDEYNELLKSKEQKILEFENYLGPALREGTWTPEDDYAKYGDKRQELLPLEGNSVFNSEGVSIGWDNCLFVAEKEESNYEEEGLDKTKVYYPCIKLTPQMWETISNFINEENDLTDIGFVWDDTVVPGINKLISDNHQDNSAIEQAKKDWEQKRDELETQNTDPTQEDLARLEELWNAYCATLNCKVPAEYPQTYRIGSEAEIAFLRPIDNPNKNVIPVLMLTNADSYCSAYDLLNETGASQTDILKGLGGCIGILSVEETFEKEVENSTGTEIELYYSVNSIITLTDDDWIPDNQLNNYERVYPRIRIPYQNFLPNDGCKIMIDDIELLKDADYTILTRYDIFSEDGTIANTNDLSFWIDEEIDNITDESNQQEQEQQQQEQSEEPSQEQTEEGQDDKIKEVKENYYITLKPDIMIKNNYMYGKYIFSYKLSNTALAIYLDAIEVLKENSIPKVTYDITPIILKTDFMEEAYNRIHTIIHINDPELKFENVQGYIYSVSLKLDEPWEDSIQVKNYTAKFEDLFSSIVASTAAIQKNAISLSVVSQAFSATGEITPKVLQNSIEVADLSLKFSKDNFIIDNSGIKALSDDGIVHYSNQGIFTATDKDEWGNWKWNTSILPTGISANAITTGQLNTNLIRIYSNDDLRFQMNGDGLFAYKSWLTSNPDKNNQNNAAAIEARNNSLDKRNGLDPAQYVVMNSEGLFLTAKKGAFLIDDNNNAVEIKQDVNRVEISWEGLVLRNNENKRTFFADPDTGNLNITGNINIEGENITAELSENKLRLGQYELVKTEINDSECLSFVYQFEAGE